ncbi:MAG: histidine phosphatase family protein [Myxococcota bacterium]|nr:histidine phosphatase family protein [Myxococcota bacterium]
MRRTLMIMRHAKSSWDNSALSDHERPLNARGRKAAPHVGLCLKSLGHQAERVFVSDSARTSETWFCLSPYMGSPQVSFHQGLYGGELDDICQLVRQVPDSVKSVLVIGHNPGFSIACSVLSGTMVELKTAYVAVLSADLECWSDIGQARVWALEDVITPKTAINQG